MEALGIPRGQYVIRVNNRKVLDGVMQAIGLSGEENSERRLTVMRAIDKFDKFGRPGVELLLGDGRTDESGDFTKGAGLTGEQIKFILSTILTTPGNLPSFEIEHLETVYDNDEMLSALSEYQGAPDLFQEGIDELSNIWHLAKSAGYGSDQISIWPSIVRGLEYYTGPVFEAELLFDVTNEKGDVVQFGSVGGGGRYDGLVKRFTGRDVPATGFSIGVSRLMTALKNLGKLGTSDVVAPVLVTVMDGDVAALGRYQKMVQDLREAGIRAEMYQGNWKKFGNQLKYADRRNCPIAIIQGSDEREAGEIQVKDLIEGKRLSEEITDNITWRESRPAQVTVKETDLIATVRGILDGQAEDRQRQNEG
jgi:histidyl-tRNA synthetase